MSLGSLFVLALAASLGSLSTIHVYDISIPGALWASTAGFLAGFFFPLIGTEKPLNRLMPDLTDGRRHDFLHSSIIK
jgi:hypothetical protein